jgi:hypothetical protein
MFEALESRQLYSTTIDTPVTPTDAADPAAPPAIDQSATADAKGKGASTSGQIYLVFRFKLVAVKTISW